MGHYSYPREVRTLEYTPYDRSPFEYASLGCHYMDDLVMLRGTVKALLENPHGRKWSLQGFGMLRLYISPVHRLHVWHPRFGVTGIFGSSVHTHPWDFASCILNGAITNIRYMKTAGRGFIPGAEQYNEQTIKCGPGGCAMSEPQSTWLIPCNPETYGVGQRYSQRAEEIHRSEPTPGTVTAIERRFKEDTEHAQVYWQGNRWVSAEPRPATAEEIEDITQAALAVWEA